MTINSNAVRDSLKRHAAWMPPTLHEELINGMRADGLVHDDGVVHAVAGGADVDAATIAAAARGLRKLTPVQAQAAAQANQALAAVFNRVRAQSARYGIELGDKPLDIHEVDAALKKAAVPTDARWNFKSMLHQLRLI